MISCARERYVHVSRFPRGILSLMRFDLIACYRVPCNKLCNKVCDKLVRTETSEAHTPAETCWMRAELAWVLPGPPR